MDGSEPGGLAWLVERELMKTYHLDEAAAFAFRQMKSAREFDELEIAKSLFLK
jgi:hypothetical protein